MKPWSTIVNMRRINIAALVGCDFNKATLCSGEHDHTD